MSETVASRDPAAPMAKGVLPRQGGTATVIRNILFPSDLSAGSDRALDHARFLAEHFRARLTLYHVVEGTPRHGASPSDPAGEPWRRAAKQACDHLDRHSNDLTIPTEVIVEQGPSAAQALVAHIRNSRPDLTVMSTHGREGLSHLLIGSVTDTVVQHGRCPVLCVREPEHGVALPYRRILVPTDLSEDSRRAFPLAALLARSFRAEVVALHVADVKAPRQLHGMSYAMEASPSEAAVGHFFDTDFRDVKVVLRVLLGSAWDHIVSTARNERVDLIVMSTHRHDSLADRIVGSHVESVVRHAPCPVLIT